MRWTSVHIPCSQCPGWRWCYNRVHLEDVGCRSLYWDLKIKRTSNNMSKSLYMIWLTFNNIPSVTYSIFPTASCQTFLIPSHSVVIMSIQLYEAVPSGIDIHVWGLLLLFSRKRMNTWSDSNAVKNRPVIYKLREISWLC